MKEPLLISACLCGKNVRYDQKNKRHPFLERLSETYRLIPFCPEVAGGLSIPRKPAEINGPFVYNIDGIDVTANYEKGARLALELCRKYRIGRALLKGNSPACGSHCIYDGTFTNTLQKGTGRTAAVLIKAGIAVYSEEEWQQLIK